jgi:hypothetical protein
MRMFNSLLLAAPLVVFTDEPHANAKPRRSLSARFQALLESLVEASSRQTFDRSFYRLPPF